MESPACQSDSIQPSTNLHAASSTGTSVHRELATGGPWGRRRSSDSLATSMYSHCGFQFYHFFHRVIWRKLELHRLKKTQPTMRGGRMAPGPGEADADRQMEKK